MKRIDSHGKLTKEYLSILERLFEESSQNGTVPELE